MKIRFVLTLIFIQLATLLFAQTTEIGGWWNDLSVYQVNKMPPRADVAVASGICLNGDWQFAYCESPKDRIKDFTRPILTQLIGVQCLCLVTGSSTAMATLCM